MKHIKWLVELANKKPLIFSLALLMIGITALVHVVLNRDRKLNECEKKRESAEKKFEIKLDSVTLYYRRREEKTTEETKAILNSIILDQKEQLEEQKQLNQEINTTIKKNETIIRKRNKKHLGR